MQVGDLVKVCTVDGYPIGLIAGVLHLIGVVPRYRVLLDGKYYPFMSYQLQLIEGQNGKT